MGVPLAVPCVNAYITLIQITLEEQIDNLLNF